MKIIKYKLGENKEPLSAIVALGFFDGVHVGHRELIEFAVKKAKKEGVASAVFTFAYGGGIKADALPIYSERDRDELLSEIGVDYLVVADFEELRNLSAEDFVKRVLIDDLGTLGAVAGFNYRFGRFGKGESDTLVSLMQSFGRSAHIIEELKIDGQTVSSTRIRSLLENGEVKGAWELLGKPYFVSGQVVHGRSDGKRFGYPTINVPARENAVKLRHGVYLTGVVLGEKLYTGMTNVGECPSFGRREYHTETFLTDYSGNAYGMQAKVYFLRFLRDERTFSSSKELIEQIERDGALVKELKGEIKWQELGLN